MPRIVVILRNTSARTVVGLDKACTEPLRLWAMQRLRVNVECVSFTNNSTLAQQAAVVGSPTIGLLGVHGAAMSNLFFCQPTTTVLEVTCGMSWSFFDELSQGLGLRHIKCHNNQYDPVMKLILSTLKN
jgi:hypothetical protein